MIAIISNTILPFNTENGIEGLVRRRLGFKQIPETDDIYQVEIIDECLDENHNIIDRKEPKVSIYKNEEIDYLLNVLEPLLQTIKGNLRVKMNEAYFQALKLETQSEIKDNEGNPTGRFRYSKDSSVWERYVEKAVEVKKEDFNPFEKINIPETVKDINTNTSENDNNITDN